jgi:hypothetical protein
MRRHAILAVEARGAAVHLREDAVFNLLQAAWLAREMVRAGCTVAIRLILDPGQSIEEYSLICHFEDEERERFQSQIALAAKPSEARRAVVRELRERNLPVTIGADQPFETAVEDRILVAAFLSRITGVNEELLVRLRELRHPMVEPGGLEDYEALLRAHVGRTYLELEAGLARAVLARFLGGDAEAVTVAPLAQTHADPTAWLSDPLSAKILDDDLGQKQRLAPADGFLSRLIGLFAPMRDAGEERAYFNSPTCCRYEHGKVRLIARDRFDLMGFRASERLSFRALDDWIAAQNRGCRARPLFFKYPYTAAYLANVIAAEALECHKEQPVRVVFVEGVEGVINSGTGGLIDTRLRRALGAAGIPYERIYARKGSRQMTPLSSGGLPLVARRLGLRIVETLPEQTNRLCLE